MIGGAITVGREGAHWQGSHRGPVILAQAGKVARRRWLVCDHLEAGNNPRPLLDATIVEVLGHREEFPTSRQTIMLRDRRPTAVTRASVPQAECEAEAVLRDRWQSAAAYTSEPATRSARVRRKPLAEPAELLQHALADGPLKPTSSPGAIGSKRGSASTAFCYSLTR
jgi:hypothetical protein